MTCRGGIRENLKEETWLAVGITMTLDEHARAAEEQYFDSAGVKLHYCDEGEGMPVVLVHGYTGSIQSSWREPGLIDALLMAGYRVVAFDNRGHGKSEKPQVADKYGIEMVRDIRRLLDSLRIDRAHVVGYSMGAVIANKFRELYPERVLTVTLGGYGQPDLPDEFTADLEAEIKTNLRKMGLLSGNDPKALGLLSLRWSQWHVSSENVRRNKTPVLALIGADDMFLADTRKLAEIMPNLRLKIIDGDHGTVPSRPEFLREVLAFLASVERR